MIVPPGSTIGIVGGGQLGRMLSIAAAQLGYRCHIFAPEPHPCATDVAACFTRGSYEDSAALRQFADSVAVVTYEFENLPAASLAALGAKLRPGVRSLEVSQDRAVEKRFVEQCGGQLAQWRQIDSLDDIEAAMAAIGLPLLLKSRRHGYDGKGQAWVRAADEGQAAWESIGSVPAVAEALVRFDAEFSVLLARTADGRIAFWDSPENRHSDGILRTSTVPAGPAIQPHIESARTIAAEIASKLDHIGVLTVEFFACAEGPIVNEIAPRVHNSGHWTIEGAATSQFEQHIRAVCGLPLGDPALLAPVTMDNLIGDDVDRVPALIAESGAHLHLYGKGDARPGRKMGHVTRVRLQP